MFSPDAARPAKRVYVGNLPPEMNGKIFMFWLIFFKVFPLSRYNFVLYLCGQIPLVLLFIMRT